MAGLSICAAGRRWSSEQDIACTDECSLPSNHANGLFPTRPQGANQMIQYGVAILNKGPYDILAILCGQRLVLNHLVSSEPVNIVLKEY